MLSECCVMLSTFLCDTLPLHSVMLSPSLCDAVPMLCDDMLCDAIPVLWNAVHSLFAAVPFALWCCSIAVFLCSVML
jgi:hypothetical protein